MDNDNLTSLQDLTQDSVVCVLKQRYIANKIYTYSGHTLVSINPYIYLPIYGRSAIQAYSSDSNRQSQGVFENSGDKNIGIDQENESLTRSDDHSSNSELYAEKDATLFYPISEAHIYSIAENALKSSCLFPHVTIIISGESGSGKTMNNNFILEYFIKRTNDTEATNLNNNFNFKINELLMAINPILEAFGNAKTVLNENSSRFGKKLDLYLEDDRIIGAKIFTYLLEKNRVTHTEENERNFHIFYYFCAYRNLNIKSDFYKFDDVREEFKKKYEEILDNFALLNICDVRHIENIIVAILILGGLKFEKNEDDYKILKNENYDELMSILEISSADFEFFLLKSTIKTPRESLIVNNSYEKILNKKNTLARNLYARLFGYLVDNFNKKLCAQKESCKTVTLLDIYGFENFKRNSFEQFCINWANEKIQDDYVKRMFVNLQNMYEEEGIILDDIKYEHKGSLELFVRPCGIVDLINEESCSNFGNEKNLQTKITNYCKDIIASNGIFQINHYAADVKYDLSGFIAKNNEIGLDFSDFYKTNVYLNKKDTIKNDFIASLLLNEQIQTIKKPTVLKTFKRSLDDLFNSINNSKILYVRCIKPNKQKINAFDDAYVLSQLKSSGIIETIEISKKTYSHYVYNEEFDERYGMLDGVYEIRRGKNRVFLSNETLFRLEQDRNALYNQYKRIILGVSKTQYELKRFENNRSVLKLILSKYVKNKHESNKYEEKQRELAVKQELERLNSVEDDIKKGEKCRDVTYERPCLPVGNECTNENYDCADDIVYPKQDEDLSNLDLKKIRSLSEHKILTNKNTIDDKETNEQVFEEENIFIDSEFRFDKKEITFMNEKIATRKNKGEMEPDKEIIVNVQVQKNDEDVITELREKLKRYEKFCKSPCRNCKSMEIKYKYQTEELKRKKVLDFEVENYKKKIKDLEEKLKEANLANTNIIEMDQKAEIKKDTEKVYNVFSKGNFVISFTSPYDVFGCLIELFIDHCPEFSTTFLPKNEVLAFAQVIYQTMYKLNGNGECMKDLTEMFVHELKERFIIFERQLHKVCFIVSNIIELKRIFIGEGKGDLHITETSYNEILCLYDDVITILFKHICEMLKKNIQDLLPDSIILHQSLKDFWCKERYLSSFFGKSVPTKKLLVALENSVAILQSYYLPDQAWEECLNYLLKTINARSFNGIIVKNDFLSYNRGMQINNNLNEIEKFCREIGFPEGIHNLEHIKEVVKLINYVKAGLKIDVILNGCSFLNFLQVMELLGKFKKEEKEYLGKDIKNYICKDIKLEKFVNESKVNVFLNFDGTEHKFLVPRYVPSKYIQSILESL